MEKYIQLSVFTFEWPKADILAGKYLCMIAAGGWVVILVLETFYRLNSYEFGFRLPIVSLFFLLPLFSFLYFILHIVSSKFTYKIVFDFERNIVESHLFHKKPIVNSISDIKMVDINWHTVFKYNGAKSIRTKANSDLIQMLKSRRIPTSWGFYGKLFLKNDYRDYMT